MMIWKRTWKLRQTNPVLNDSKSLLCGNTDSVRRIFLCLSLLVCLSSCGSGVDQSTSEHDPPKHVIIADSFAAPVGKSNKITQAKDSKDNWYNAQDFGENNHLGEDWNANSGGNTDCGGNCEWRNNLCRRCWNGLGKRHYRHP